MNSIISKTISQNRVIYCANSLFTPFDRVSGDIMAKEIEYYLTNYIKDNNLNATVSDFVFLPFRDTNQKSIIGKDRAHKIYKLDIVKLNNSSCLIARLDGIAKDSGIAMEIGYAFGKQIPIFVLSTSFMWEGFIDNDDDIMIDPIIYNMATYFENSYKLINVSKNYFGNNYMQEFTTISKFVSNVFQEKLNIRKKLISNQIKNSVYIDIMGGKYNWARNEQYFIKTLLSKYTSNINFAKRYTAKNIDELNIKSNIDIQNALNSEILIISGDGQEIDTGSSTILGMCKALNKTIIYIYTSDFCLKGDGKQKMLINLMIDQASDLIIRDYKQIDKFLKHYYKYGKFE